MSTVAAELQRRDQNNALQPWRLNNDGSDPVADAAVVAQLNITLSALRDAVVGVGAAAKTLADVVAALQASQPRTVSGTVGVSNLPATQPVSGPLTDIQLRASAPPVRDDYQAGETLADQTGAGGVLTFTFAAAVQLIVIEAKGANLTARADAFGGTPSVSQGVVCDDATPTYIPATASVVKVFAPSSMVVSCYGLRRA